MSHALREVRLGNDAAQMADGRFISPVSQEAGVDNIREFKVLFSQLTIDDTVALAGNNGYPIIESGYGLQVNPTSDPAAIVYISIDDGKNYMRFKPGDYIETAGLFDRIYIKKPSSLPSTSQAFWVTVFKTRAVRLNSGAMRSTPSLAGATNFAVTVTPNPTLNGQAPTNIAPFRATRTKVVIRNQGINDVYLGPSGSVASPLSATTGELLPAGGETTYNVTADIYCVAAVANTQVTAREEYTT